MEAQAAVSIEPGTDSLQQAVVACSWRIEVPEVPPAQLADRVSEVLALHTLPVTVDRKGSPVELDARPAIHHLEVDGPELVADIATQPRSLRPAELVRALGSDWREGLVLRTHQWTLVDGARCEPIPLGDGARGATSAVHAQVRAS
jgi:hypothetical protein